MTLLILRMAEQNRSGCGAFAPIHVRLNIYKESDKTKAQKSESQKVRNLKQTYLQFAEIF
jgi:hypothetical protein